MVDVNRIVLFLFLTFSCVVLNGQDVHFSMYDFSPLTLNPAETGVHSGDWRAVVNYREQWKAVAKPYQTIAASYDQNIYLLPGKFSAGLVFLSDQSGAVDLSQNRVYLSIGYKKETSLWMYSAGVQGGYVNKSYNLSSTSFPEQYNEEIGSFDSSLPLSEQNLSNQTSYFDLNVGGLVSRKLKSSVITAGISILHLNQPDVSFFENKDKLSARTNTYANWRIETNGDLFFKPAILASTARKAQEWVIGGDVGMELSHDQYSVREIYLGLDMRNGINRNGDAFIASIGFGYGNFDFGFAYDINHSSIDQATNNRGAFEISVIYISPSTAIKKITIPCDRY